MYTYRGVINYDSYAVNESITVNIPTNFNPTDSVQAYWQWTKDAKGGLKTPVNWQGAIDTVTILASGRKIGFFDNNYYRFDGEVSADLKTMSVTMTSIKGGKSDLIKLNLVYSNK